MSQQPLRVVFMGTSAFAKRSLEALAELAHVIIPAVYTQPPRKAGRGHKLQKTDVHEAAENLGLEVRTPTSLKTNDAVDALAMLEPDLALVASYGLLLPPAILSTPRLGCVNIHASILPRWRGAAPIQQAILHGDEQSGVDYFQMEKGLDTGPILLRQTTPIQNHDTGGSLHDRLACIASGMVGEFIEKLSIGTLKPEIQNEQGAIYAPKIEKSDRIVDWRKSASSIERMIRAYTPWPGAWTHIGDERFRICEAIVHPNALNKAAPGTCIETPLIIATGNGLLEIQTIQRAGRKPMSVRDLLRGFDIPTGSRFGD